MKKSEEESTQNGVEIFYTFWQYALTDDDSRTIPSTDIPTNHSETMPAILTPILRSPHRPHFLLNFSTVVNNGSLTTKPGAAFRWILEKTTLRLLGSMPLGACHQR